MNPEQRVLLALMKMGEYEGPIDAFLRESATIIRATLKCSQEEADRLLERLQETGKIERSITQGGPLGQEPIPSGKSFWRIPKNH